MSFVESMAEVTPRLVKIEELQFYIKNDQINTCMGTLVAGKENPIGFVNPTDRGDAEVVVVLPPLWTIRNQVLLFSVIEHEFLHASIFEVEGYRAGHELDNTWLGKYTNLIAVRGDGTYGYDDRLGDERND